MALTCRVQYLNDIDPFAYTTNFPEPPRPPVHTFSCSLPLINQIAAVHRLLRAPHRLDDTALQLYKDGDYGSYLDLDASINEQQEEFDNFQSNRKNSIVLRTQLSVRVHTIIEKLQSSEGRELRRALFSLKQIFQEDKDLVHEFVQNDGLACLIRVGSDADQNYQNYILRALGQVMLYVDGMNGVMEHSPTVQWLYSLVASKFRLVVKTALKLLLVFVEYTETNSVLLVKAIQAVDSAQGNQLWWNVMRLMKEYDAADTELLIYATSLVNKTLNGLPDQDTYYDQVDALEEQGFENIIRRYMSKQGTDLDLLRQFQIYEAVLQHEDGEQKGAPLKQLDETIRKTLRHRKCLTTTLNPLERRKSRRHSTGTSPHNLTLNLTRPANLDDEQTDEYHNVLDEGGVGVTPALRRRRERAERQRSFLREQREAALLATLSSTDQSSSEDGGVHNGYCNGDSNHGKRENSVKDLTQKLASTLGSPGALDADGKPITRMGEMKGIISKAKEGLAKSQSRGDVLKSPTSETPPPFKPPEVKKSETELHWEELVSSCSRALNLCDLDFTDLHSDDEQSVFAATSRAPGAPPPPPPGIPPPCNLPPPIPAPAAPPPLTSTPSRLASPVRKNKKTVKLFWKEVRDDPVVFAKLNSTNLIWDEMSPVAVDIQKLEHLFESRAKDLITKEKQQEINKNKEVIVLDPKRSNAINIGMTKLPPPRSIKTAILKMDATIMNREGIEKLLTMLPTEEECSKIQEAQAANPEIPLGSAEQFLLTLASISELPARLKLWAFKLDFENSEKEIAEPLMDLKQGIETLKSNKTFRAVLGTLLSIGIFLNGNEVKGFQIEYLAKVPEVKDTVHKHSLLHHLCHMVMDKFPDSTDLYSEIGAVTRASKVDFDELTSNIMRLETECKASFDNLKVITKHDGSCTNMKVKMSDFLADCAERIIVLGKVHRRVMNRYFKFCLWLGIPYHRVQATKPNELCRVISEFALEYRTTRERVMQQLEKKASHRERNKTRGKMITEMGKFRREDDRADAELRQLLGNDSADNETSLTGSLPWRRTRKDTGKLSLGNMRNDGTNGNLTDADDEILESLVKTATQIPATRTAPRERKRTRHADRKSLIKRSRTRDNVPVEGNESQS
ncbi:FH1/FH2 domain-containing protein 3 isoform X2 [Macrosteles quadrilineatus]|uniref:FH1/FH2 domain-containing protein 3 isoform X2 n=1 Tax=Macrosteles quadrilineatus TaxID=74068 RepID=UPI0023E2337C|nr:FH1/FH2 domain-containing protein 3 isoform X2 [Macrosteles quadrilineatus]